MKMDEATSHQKEVFVSNTSGTSLLEIFLLTITPVLSCALHASVKENINTLQNGAISSVSHYIIENLLLVTPVLFSVTVLSNHLLVFTSILVVLVTYLFYRKISRHGNKNFVSTFKYCEVIVDTCLTNYKAFNHIATAICILAVDFNVFPRRFAKAEVYGVGIMDMAVGSIIFSNGLTSTQARMTSCVTLRNIWANARTSLVLVILGLLRIFAVKGSNYQEHVTEYGVHWNFFFTIAVVKPLATFILYILPSWRQPPYLFLSLFIIAIYQYCLSSLGLTDIIQNGSYGDKSRLTFFDANREGISSCIGYLSIYFCGLFFGKQMFKVKPAFSNKLCWLGLWFLAGGVSTILSMYYVTPISRQMCNVSYFLIQITFNSLLLFGFLLIDMIYVVIQKLKSTKKDVEISYSQPSMLCVAVSGNLLLYFLLANVFTGAVNFSFDTIQSNEWKSMTIIMSYLLTVNLMIWFVFKVQWNYNH